MRPIEEGDAEALFRLDSDLRVHQFLGNQPVKSIDEVTTTIRYIHQQYLEHGIGRLAVVDRETDKFLGWSGLKWETGIRPEEPYYDLGYRFLPESWGKGIATEAAQASLEFGFRDLGIQQIGAAAHSDNLVSNRILRKLGFRRNGSFFFDKSEHYWHTLSSEMWIHEPSLAITEPLPQPLPLVRLFREEDAEAVSTVIRKTMAISNANDYPEEVLDPLRAYFTPEKVGILAKERICLVASVKGAIVGTVSLDQGEVATMFVSPEYQNQGIGTSLFQSLEAFARREGVTELRVPSSVTGEKFYQSLGFQALERIETETAGQQVRMQKPLMN